jgi:hypothetical protein
MAVTPYYEDGTVTIYHGDCRDVMPELRADVIVTDPPYGFGAYATDKAPPPGVLRSLIDRHTTVAVFGYPEILVGWCVTAGVTPDEWVTWWPTNRPAARSSGLPRSSEHVAVFGPTPGVKQLTRPRSKGGAQIAARWGLSEEVREGDVWRDVAPGVMFNTHQRLHPNEKPLSLMVKLVQMCSSPDQTILDPYMGSGTTLRAAKDLGRRVIGVEIDERHCETAVRRLGQGVLPFGGAA